MDFSCKTLYKMTFRFFFIYLIATVVLLTNYNLMVHDYNPHDA